MRHKQQTSVVGEGMDPNLHDAKLTGIVLRGKDAVIELETEKGVALRLVLLGVQRLVANDFREGNTVLAVAVVTGPMVDARDVAAAFGVAPDGQTFLTEAVVCSGMRR